jgi:MFS family permease
MGNNGALLSAIILGLVNLGSILVSAAVVDRFGRRFLFITGGILMLFCLVSKLSNHNLFIRDGKIKFRHQI